MQFCTQCAATLTLTIPPGDNLPRHVCTRCGFIHYQNPKLVVGCVATFEDKVLLCRRAIEPRKGLWTLPAGFMENGESSAQAAARETREEACAVVEVGALFSLIDIPQINQIHLFYLGHLRDGTHAAGEESLETALLSEAEIPWESLAFKSVSYTLNAFFADREKQHFGMHTHAVTAYNPVV